jgi:hypothetical protein
LLPFDIPVANTVSVSAQNNTRRMTSEEERLARLRRMLHSLATRVPKIILKRVDSTFPALKIKTVSVIGLN